jgi:hypothetical protein
VGMRAGEAIEDLLIAREVAKKVVLGRVKIPRPDEVTGKSSRSDINPVGGGFDLLDVGIGRKRLAGPGADGAVGEGGLFAGIDSGVFAGVSGEPGIDEEILSVGVSGGDQCDRARQHQSVDGSFHGRCCFVRERDLRFTRRL